MHHLLCSPCLCKPPNPPATAKPTSPIWCASPSASPRTPLAHGLQHHRPAARHPRPDRRFPQGAGLPSRRPGATGAALDYGGLAVLNDAWSRFGLEELFAGIGSARQRGLLQAIIYSRLLFPCAKLSLAQKPKAPGWPKPAGWRPRKPLTRTICTARWISSTVTGWAWKSNSTSGPSPKRPPGALRSDQRLF